MHTQVAIVGGGPAGLSASIEIAKRGAKVTLIDENRRPGGQLFKQIHKFFGSKEHQAGIRGIDIGTRLLKEAEETKVDVLLNTVAWGIFKDKTLALIRNQQTELLETEKIILATGASENALSFPGWTLPGVMGAGAAQTMVNIHRVLPGRNVLMVGSGNVGLIVSYQLLQAGANVIAVLEAAPKIGGYAVHASKIRRAGVPIITSCTIKEAVGKDFVEEVIIIKLDENWNPIPKTEKNLKVDMICIGVGLSPLAELAWMCGCKTGYFPELGGYVPLHNENMETTIPGIYIAGDISGVEEANTALEEGRLAGTAILQELGRISKEEAENQNGIIHARLSALRLGPFGKLRAETKNRIYSEMKICDKE